MRLPSHDSLSYCANGLTVLFLLLALPVVLYRLFTRPKAAMKGAARKQIG